MFWVFFLVVLSCGSEVTAENTPEKTSPIGPIQKEIQEDLQGMHEKLDCMTLMVGQQELPKECQKYLVTTSP